MSEIIFTIKESDEGGYTASALGYSIFTEADSWEEFRDQVKDAVNCHFNDNEFRVVKLRFLEDGVIKA